MSTAFDSIKQGLQEAIAHAEGHGRGVRVHRPRPVDVNRLVTDMEELVRRTVGPSIT